MSERRLLTHPWILRQARRAGAASQLLMSIIFAAWYADTTLPDETRYVGLAIGFGFALYFVALMRRRP